MIASAWSRYLAKLNLGTALLIGGLLYGLTADAQAPTAQTVAVPRTVDGEPDLSGIWIRPPVAAIRGKYDENGGEQSYAARDGTFVNFENDNALARMGDRNKPLYKPEFWAKVRENDANGNELDPEYKCRLYGVPRLGAPSQIVQSKGLAVLLYAGGFAGQNTFRVVPTDGRPHNPARVVQETWKGDPVAHWEGNTLVIDTIGFTDESWLHKSGYFHGFKLHVLERLTREGNTLRWVATVDDPEVLLEPWTMTPITRVLDTNPNAFVPEDLPCEERDSQHFKSKVRSG
jgi:hypothetical protein